MSYRLVHDALHTDGLSVLAKLVLVALADYANDETGECYPSQGTIAKIVGCSRQSVYEQIDNLESLGYVRRLGKYRLGLKYKVTIQPSQSDCDNSAVTIDKSPDCDNSAVMTALPSQLTTPSSMTAQPSGVTTQPSGVTTQPSGYDGSAVTNREENREKKREYNQGRKDIHPTPHAQNKESAWKDIALKAALKLTNNGMSNSDALSKVWAVKAQFLARAESLKASGELAAKSNPTSYLVAVLSSMALEGPKPTSTAAQQTDDAQSRITELKHQLDRLYMHRAEYRMYADSDKASAKLLADILPKIDRAEKELAALKDSVSTAAA